MWMTRNLSPKVEITVRDNMTTCRCIPPILILNMLGQTCFDLLESSLGLLLIEDLIDREMVLSK